MRAYVVALVGGLAAVILATVVGGAGTTLDAIASPPTLVRAALIGASAVLGLWLLSRALVALSGGDAPERDMATMIRGVRLAFLAVAAVAAAAGWFIGHPLLLVVGLVIAGVDLVETSFLLIVARSRRDRPPDA